MKNYNQSHTHTHKPLKHAYDKMKRSAYVTKKDQGAENVQYNLGGKKVFACICKEVHRRESKRILTEVFPRAIQVGEWTGGPVR